MIPTDFLAFHLTLTIFCICLVCLVITISMQKLIHRVLSLCRMPDVHVYIRSICLCIYISLFRELLRIVVRYTCKYIFIYVLYKYACICICMHYMWHVLYYVGGSSDLRFSSYVPANFFYIFSVPCLYLCS